jgi:hypothetical protein
MSPFELSAYPFMVTMNTCLKKVISEGYTEKFSISAGGLESAPHTKTYKPEEIRIVNSYRFEGISNPKEEAIIYVIETEDGTKGTLTDAFADDTNPGISSFMKNVESIRKKI